MFDLFGEFDSAEELNLAAAGQREQGDREALLSLAKENGIDQEDAEDYMDGLMDELVNPLMAAVGKIEVENKHLKLAGVLEDWKDAVLEMCTEDEKMQRAVRKKGKSLKECIKNVEKRMERSGMKENPIDVMIVLNEKMEIVIQYKK